MSINRYDYLLDVASNFTSAEKTDMCTQLDEIPVQFINCMVRGGWKLKRNDAISSDGRTDIEAKVINLKSKVLLNPWRVIAHEIIHVVDFQNYYDGNGFISRRKDLIDLYNTEKPKLVASGNSMWVSNEEEYLSYMCAAVITNIDKVPFQYSPNSEVWARNFVLAQPLPVPTKIESLEKGKVEDIRLNTANNKLEIYKGGVKTEIQLPNGGGGGGTSNIIWDNTVTESTSNQYFQENTITYSYKDGEGVNASTLLMTYVGVGKMDFYQLKYEMGGQLSLDPVIKHRGGDRYGWQDWKDVGGSGGTTPSYTLPTATTSVLGGVKIGTNINISNGTISVNTATTSTLGLAKFDSADFNVSGGNVSLKPSTVVNKTISGGILTLGSEPYQKCTSMVDATEIRLPSASGFKEICLFFDTTTNLTLILPNCKWQTAPEFKANKTYMLIFTYDGGKWLGGMVEYGV